MSFPPIHFVADVILPPVEIVNSVLAPPATFHAFTFTIPRHDTLAAAAARARERLESTVSGPVDFNRFADASSSTATVNKAVASAPELSFYGVTLTVWTHADKNRAVQLKAMKSRSDRIELGAQNSLNAMNPVSPSYHRAGQRKASTTPDKKGTRRSLGHVLRNQSEADTTIGSETETGMSDSDMEGPTDRRRGWMDRLSVVESVPEDVKAVFDEQIDVFWMPYAITLVSRYPIYDTLQDYLGLSWARFSKNARVHMSQVSRLLNTTIPPRPGGAFRLPIGISSDDQVILKGCMPGGLIDFDKGLVKVDFQIWPLFQALDLDHIIICAEVALSNSGRIIFCSKHPAMLNIAVSSLKYLVELGGWNGVAVPVIHARDATFIIEDPGPFIIGLSSECRYVVAPPAEVVIVDLDSNSLSCRSPLANVISPRARREKAKQKLLAALGPTYPADRSIPMEFKVSYPKGAFRPLNKITWSTVERPNFLGERLREPGWWKFESVMSVFDKILAHKHKKPSLIQRLTRSGVGRAQAQLTVGEQLAKAMMRRRALHYVEARDDLEIKVAKINRRLLKLIQEGEHWKSQFETFEKYADKLTNEANELKIKIERERREAKRLSSIANEQTQVNLELEEKLENTETARAEAMRQLSDMHQSIQELEREREEIINSIEMQIGGALDHYLPQRPPSPSISSPSSRPGTPGDALASPTTGNSHGSLSEDAACRKSKERPMTADSQQSFKSGMSGMTGLSVLGHARGERRRRESVVDTLRTGGDGRAYTGALDIAQRVANIHAKLEMALGVVARQNASGEGEGETSADMTLTNPPHDTISTDGALVTSEPTPGEESDDGTEKGSRTGSCLLVRDGSDSDLGSWGSTAAPGDDDGEEKVKEWVEDDGLNKRLSGLSTTIHFGKAM